MFGITPGRRFTPTGVGSRVPTNGAHCNNPVHPHRRGEQLMSAGAAKLPVGSPPQAWGAGPFLETQATITRFTPTGVGSRATLLK